MSSSTCIPHKPRFNHPRRIADVACFREIVAETKEMMYDEKSIEPCDSTVKKHRSEMVRKHCRKEFVATGGMSTLLPEFDTHEGGVAPRDDRSNRIDGTASANTVG